MAYNNKSVGPLKITEAAYNKQNRKMRKENPTMGSKLTSGTSPRRVSFACRFGSMQGDMKDKNGTPSKLAKALKKWGFGWGHKRGPFKMKSPLYKKGLWDNIHAKRKRIKDGSGETMRKPGSKGAPSKQDLLDSQN